MNILVSGFLSKNLMPIIFNLTREFPVQICYKFHAENYYPKDELTPPPGTEFVYLELKDMLSIADNPNMPWHSLRPLETEIIKKMGCYEREIYGTMDRYPWYYFLSQIDHKQVYYKFLRFWNDFLEKNEIKLMIYSHIPHELIDLVIYYLCKEKGIPTVLLHLSYVDTHIMLLTNLEEQTEELKPVYNQMLEKFKDIPENKIQLRGRFQEIFTEQLGKTDPVPWYFQAWKESLKNQKEPVISKIISRIFSIFAKIKLPNYGIFNMFIDALQKIDQNYDIERKLFEFYESNAVEPDLTEKFVYVPLHYQPENTTVPLGGVFADQLLMIEMLAAALPPDVYLYVKDHPAQPSMHRDYDYYRRILEIPQARLIHRFYNSFRLTEHCGAIATVTGTAAWEALFREKPVLIFGFSFIDCVRGCYSVKNFDDCKRALESIFISGEKPSLKEMKVFLNALDAVLIEAFPDRDYEKIARITPEENVRNLTQGYTKIIKSLGF